MDLMTFVLSAVFYLGFILHLFCMKYINFHNFEEASVWIDRQMEKQKIGNFSDINFPLLTIKS